MWWWVLTLALIVCYIFYKLLVFFRADGDLTVISKRIKPEYFKGKVIWITGASSGIGEELCYQLSKAGAKLIMTARNEEKLNTIWKSLSVPDNAKVLPIDLGNPEATRAATDKAKRLFGTNIDILINNAGVSTRSIFIENNEAVHRRVMELNLFAPWILTHDVLPGMLSQGFGHVVNISSLAGKFGTNKRTSYCASKFGIIGMMDSLRVELANAEVKVTNVCPGPVKTDVSKNALNSDGSKFGEMDKLIENGMSVERCVELILVGISNQLKEVWVSKQPLLSLTYLAMFFGPDLPYYILKRESLQQKYFIRKTD